MRIIDIIDIENNLELDTIRYEYDDLQPDTFYVMDDDTTFYTPDGVGGFYYDSFEEALEQHG